MQRTIPMMQNFNFFASRQVRPPDYQPNMSLPKKRGRK